MELTQRITDALLLNRRPPDTYLHPSSDLAGCLRCTQLRLGNAPAVQGSYGGQARLLTGTLWHSWLEEVVKGEPVMHEVDLTPWMHQRWSGTADLFRWEDGAFTLYDYKTIKPEAIPYLKGMAKEDHVWQASSYYWAAKRAGFPLNDMPCVVYLPMGDGPSIAGPIPISFVPINEWSVNAEMHRRATLVDDYLSELNKTGDFLNDKLDAPLDRTQKVKKTATGFDLVLAPHWRTQFCPFDLHGCCSVKHPRQEKIGHYDFNGNYHYRRGYEHVQPEVSP